MRTICAERLEGSLHSFFCSSKCSIDSRLSVFEELGVEICRLIGQELALLKLDMLANEFPRLVQLKALHTLIGPVVFHLVLFYWERITFDIGNFNIHWLNPETPFLFEHRDLSFLKVLLWAGFRIIFERAITLSIIWFFLMDFRWFLIFDNPWRHALRTLLVLKLKLIGFSLNIDAMSSLSLFLVPFDGFILILFGGLHLSHLLLLCQPLSGHQVGHTLRNDTFSE